MTVEGRCEGRVLERIIIEGGPIIIFELDGGATLAAGRPLDDFSPVVWLLHYVQLWCRGGPINTPKLDFNEEKANASHGIAAHHIRDYLAGNIGIDIWQ